MNDTIFHISDKRHKWVQMREYKVAVLFRCRVCKKISKGFKYDASMNLVVKLAQPLLMKNFFLPSPLMKLLKEKPFVVKNRRMCVVRGKV